MSFSWDPCSCKYVQHQVQQPSRTNVCVFCLNLCDRSFSLPSCTHLGIFEDICHKLKTQDVGICVVCHRMLVKCNLFKNLVEESVQSLNNQTAKVSTIRNFCDLHQSIPTVIEIKQNFTSNNILTIIPLNSELTAADTPDVDEYEVKSELVDEIDVENDPANIYNESSNSESSIIKLTEDVDNTILDYFNNSDENIIKQVTVKPDKDPLGDSDKNTKYTEHNILDVSKKSNGDENQECFDSCERSEAGDTIKKTKDQPKVHKCIYCPATFETLNQVKYHRTNKHKTSECLKCGKVLCNSSSLGAHMRRVHAVAEPKTCDKCGKSFKMIRDLQRHIRSVHDYDSSAKVYCAPCDTSFKTKNHYNTHLKTHPAHVKDSDKKFECAECNGRFISKYLLRLHIESDHLNNSKFRCAKCDKKFKRPSDLRYHVDYTHDKKARPKKAKDKICEVCGKAFSENIYLKIHMRVHTGERPLRCDHCDATFAYPAALRTHRKLKHKVLPKKAQTQETSKVPQEGQDSRNEVMNKVTNKARELVKNKLPVKRPSKTQETSKVPKEGQDSRNELMHKVTNKARKLVEYKVPVKRPSTRQETSKVPKKAKTQETK